MLKGKEIFELELFSKVFIGKIVFIFISSAVCHFSSSKLWYLLLITLNKFFEGYSFLVGEWVTWALQCVGVREYYLVQKSVKTNWNIWLSFKNFSLVNKNRVYFDRIIE